MIVVLLSSDRHVVGVVGWGEQGDNFGGEVGTARDMVEG